MRSARGHVSWRVIKRTTAVALGTMAVGYVVLMAYKYKNTEDTSTVSETVQQAIAAVRSWKDDYRESPEFKQKVENILEYDHQNHIQAEAEKTIDQIETDKAARMKALEDEANAKIEIERAKIREAIEKKRELEKVTESVRMKAIGRIRSSLDKFGKAQYAEVVYDPTLPKALLEICGCESAGSPQRKPRHYNDDGTVLQGRLTPSDYGACQISEPHWGKTAHQLGFDIRDEEDNYRMSKFLYVTQGAKPWYLSAGCHGHHSAVASL